jgi:maleylacetate reductase
VVLPYSTALAAPRAPGADVRIAAALGSDDASASGAIAALAHRLGAPSSLHELGLREDQLDEAVGLVDDALSRLPQPVSSADTEALMRAAFAGAAPVAEVGAA